jgi:hypothetical protein
MLGALVDISSQPIHSDIYLNPMWLEGSVADIRPSTLAQLRLQRAALIESYKSSRPTVLVQRTTLDSEGSPRTELVPMEEVVKV